MDPATPPDLVFGFFIASCPALLAAVFAAASALVAAVPPSRKAALRETASPASRRALDRYLAEPSTLEARWLVLRVFAVSLSAVLLPGVLTGVPLAFRPVSAALMVLLLYAVPAQLTMALTQPRAETLLPWALRLLRPLELLAIPVADPLAWLGRLVAGPVAASRSLSPSLAETEMELLVSENEQSGALAHDQSEMIRNVLDFGDLRAGDIMVPRVQVVAVDEAEEPGKLLELIGQARHSRYPVYRQRSENVVGVLHVKDLLEHVAVHGLQSVSVRSLMRTPVVYTPHSQLASAMLAEMRAGRHHMVVVVDEFGTMSGIATLEDVVEKIVGNIKGEDEDEPPIVDLGQGRLMVSASIPVADLNRYLGIELREDDAYNSLGGYLIERLGHVPQVGVTVQDDRVDLIVREADERRVEKVEVVTRPDPSPDSLPPQSSTRSAA